jgi:endoribonuclease Dicer
MEALTTSRCLECFSYERLELLGDSFLKYAISCHLFLKYEKKHEGQLSARRAWGISNATLHRLAMTRNLPVSTYVCHYIIN